jgi:Ca-activated chloride channel family protein
MNTEAYDRIVDNPFLAAAANPLSTFSIDVDRASFANIRRFITRGQLPPRDAVRIEEMINYFPYDYPEPAAGHPFSVTTELAAAPWNRQHRLLRIGLQGRRIETANLPPSNLVFLIDVSGSMQAPNKLDLVKSSLRLLVEQLREQDRVSMVVYASQTGLVLMPTSGTEKATILNAIDRLEAGGSTAGGAGLRLAYRAAGLFHVPTGNNRIILASDGDFNVGESSDAEMERLIEAERNQGIFLTVLGYGMGNLKNAKLELLADKGNGNYAYIDDFAEARKTLVEEVGGTLVTIAKDVKLQVEFNPAKVQGYRLIGYENRLLRAEDFNDDNKDAGEMGAGHSVTALYEIIPAGVRSTTPIRGVDSLRYQTPPTTTAAAAGSELLFVKLRYKEPTGDSSRLLSHVVADRVAQPSSEFTFAAAIAEFGMILRDSEYKGTATLEDAISLAQRSLGADPRGYRAEFVRIVQSYQRLLPSDRH